MMDQHTPRSRRRFFRSRSRFLLVAALAVGVLSGLGAQAAGPEGVASLSLTDLDLSSASIHQAGPTSFYVRGVSVDDESYSFLMEQSETAVWSIVRIIPESANILPPDTILDFATISAPDGSTIQIDGVLVGTSVYGGSLSVGEDADLELAEQIRRTSDTTINEARSEALRAIIRAENQAQFDAAVAEQRVALEVIIDRVQAERDELAAENDRLAAERDALQAERDRLEAELDAAGESAAGEAVRDGARVSPLSGEQVESLLRERDQLAGDVVGLVMENNELRDERKTLREQIEGLQTRNTELREDVEMMTSEVDRLEELVSAGPPPGWAFPGDYVKTADLDNATRAVSGELQSLERRVAALETAAVGLARLEEELRTGVRGGLPGARLASEPAGGLLGAAGPAERSAATERDPEREPTPATATEADALAAAAAAEQAERLALVQAELADLLAENEALRVEKQLLEERVLDEILNNGFVRMMEERLTRRLASGFSTGEPDTGAWSVRSGTAVQTDPDAYFAKLSMPVHQSDDPVLYSFRVRSLDDGWVGVGLHLFVEDVAARRGYGMGSSLLVWFTRDPDERKSPTTYLQLYRSDDDVSMARVLDAAIPEAVDDFLRVDVLYEPQSQYITIAVDGSDRVRYRTWFGIDSGVEVALRSLGRAEFRDFSVQTLPVAP